MDPYFYSDGTPVLTMLSSTLSSFVSMGLTALIFISRWLIFNKMGMPGWKGIIPMYSDYVLFRTLWSVKAFWAYVIGMIVFVGLYGVGLIAIIVRSMYLSLMRVEPTFERLLLIFVVMAIALVVFLVYQFIIMFRLYRRLANAFGKSTGFAAGLTFLTPIFMPILAFGKAQYRGAPPHTNLH